MSGLKRSLEESSHDGDRPSPSDSSVSTVKPASPAAPSSASSFRNVSACNRCRLRKNRCDQRLPSCASCDKASVKCVGYDPITKREIPRSYVYYLETRVAYLETLLQEHSITFQEAEDFNPAFAPSASSSSKPVSATTAPPPRNGTIKPTPAQVKEESDKYDREKLTKLVSNIGMVSVQGASDPRYLGSTSGISFARVVFAAVKSSVSGSSSERGSNRGGKVPSSVVDSGTSMRDSFFGLQTKPTIRQAPFPDRELGSRLVELYFEHANPQIPILHRGEFMELFERVYASGERNRTSRESYMLNIVFAIGAGIILGSSDSEGSPTSDHGRFPTKSRSSPPSSKKRRLAGHQHHPEEYHASAIVHLENFLGSSPAADRPDGFGGGLEELQAVLLLAGFALLRPVAPGLWYIVGVAVRLGVDLGLHYEDGVGIDGAASEDPTAGNSTSKTQGNGSATAASSANTSKIDAKERGRRQWVRDLRRRLWWCVYSLDRLVSTCVGRPFGITDQIVTTEFPSLLDDRYITKEGFLTPPPHQEKPTYKIIAHHYFRLRLLQSEILQVLQHRQAQQARASGANRQNEFMHTKLPSPFLVNFESFRAWRVDVDRRLLEWKDSAPTQQDAGVQFSPLFLELNYWQALIMLYRQSLVVPSGLQDELGNTGSDMGSPSMSSLEEREDEDLVFLKVAEAGQKVLKLYRQLHRVHLVNYTFLATHHLFMAGISFLYAVWHSVHVRSLLSLDDVDFTVLAATSVLGDLIDKCPPAEACRDAFDRMSKATIQMCMSTTGFGPQALRSMPQLHQHYYSQSSPSKTHSSADADTRSDTDMQGYGAGDTAGFFSQQRQHQQQSQQPQQRRPIPRFDMNLKELFSDDETDKRSFSRVSNQVNAMRPPPPPLKQQLQQPFTADLKISPQLRHPSLQQQQQQQQQQQTPFYPQSPTQQSTNTFSTTPPANPPMPSPYQVPYPPFSQNLNSSYPDLAGFSDLDFLESFPLTGASGVGGAANSDGSATSAMQDVGIGFGMGFGDGTHDWSDGNGLDLFDGFFFGKFFAFFSLFSFA